MGITKDLLLNYRVKIKLYSGVEVFGKLLYFDLDSGRLTLTQYNIKDKDNKTIDKGEVIVLQNKVWMSMMRVV